MSRLPSSLIGNSESNRSKYYYFLMVCCRPFRKYYVKELCLEKIFFVLSTMFIWTEYRVAGKWKVNYRHWSVLSVSQFRCTRVLDILINTKNGCIGCGQECGNVAIAMMLASSSSYFSGPSRNSWDFEFQPICGLVVLGAYPLAPFLPTLKREGWTSRATGIRSYDMCSHSGTASKMKYWPFGTT